MKTMIHDFAHEVLNRWRLGKRGAATQALTMLPALALGAFGLVIPTALAAEDFLLDWSSFVGGADRSSGGDFELVATVGDASTGMLQGGDFSIVEGFWSIAAVVEGPMTLGLGVDRGANQFVLSWPVEGGAGFVLEQTGILETPSARTTWTAVSASPQTNNGTNLVRLPLAAGNRFFRLHKP